MGIERFRNWRLEKDSDDIFWLTFDRAEATANTFSREVFDELDTILTRLEDDTASGLVIISAKPTGFIAGADIKEISQSATDKATVRTLVERGQELFARVEALPFRSLAAIHGFCMGGGTELALACSYRIATSDDATRIGLPEVLLGFHPGWGGTIRLPRLIGGLKGMTAILTGRAYRASAAKKLGIVDQVVPQELLLEAARQMILKKPRPRRASPMEKLTNVKQVRRYLAGTMRKRTAARVREDHYPAPFAAINLWEQYAGDWQNMYAKEVDSFVDLAGTDTCRNLIRVFFLREQLRQAGKHSDVSIRRVHVIGAGVMGGDIAAWCVLKGLDVSLQDREMQYIKPALSRARKLFEKKLRQPARVQEAMSRLAPDPHGDGVAHADLVIEAIFEDAEAKRSLFQDMQPRLKPGAIVATNTSSIPLEDLRDATADPSRFVGLHFFNPVAKMPLVEVVRQDQVSEETIAAASAFAGRISKLPLNVRSSPGFVVNRVLMPYLMEAMSLLQSGVPGRAIDEAALDFGMPMGPIELADVVGLDVCAYVGQVLSDTLGVELPGSLDEMIEAGHRGKKDGQGFYVWKKGKAIKPPLPADYTPPHDLEARLILPLLNESVAVLREKIVADGDLLDGGVIFGTGFAPFRGGPINYAREAGVDNMVEELDKLAVEYGKRFKPDPGWKALPSVGSD